MRRSERDSSRDTRSARLAALLLPLVLFLAACGASDETPIGPPQPLDPLVPAAQKAYAVTLGRQVIETYFAEGREAALAVPVTPGVGQADVTVPRIFVTLRADGTLRASMGATEAPFGEMVRAGVVAAIEDERFGGPLRAEEVASTVLEFNAMFDEEPLGSRSLDGLAEDIEPGRHAFEFVHPEGRAFFKETVMITHDYSHATAFERLCLKAGLPEDCYSLDATDVLRYRAEHWVEDAADPVGFFELFRGHRRIAIEDVTPAAVREAARLAFAYMANHRRADGGFDYLYLPEQDATDDSQDNAVRQAGAIYAASRGATFFEDEALVAASRGAIDNLLTHEATFAAGGSYIDWGVTSLGLTGLGLLGIAELRATEDYRDAAYRLADAIAANQREDGRLRSDFVGDDREGGQQYYPGEAALALVRLMDRYDEDRWRPVLEKAFDYYVAFWHDAGQAAFVPWHSAAWLGFFRQTGDRKYADFAFEMLDSLLDGQDRTSYGDWRRDDHGGSLARGADGVPTFSTGTFLEPVPLAIAVARELGDDARADRYAAALRHGLRFSLQLVITDRETFFMPSPARSIGGVRTSLTDVHVRIDNVQHVATAFAHALLHTPDEAGVWQ